LNFLGDGVLDFLENVQEQLIISNFRYYVSYVFDLFCGCISLWPFSTFSLEEDKSTDFSANSAK